jgi:hypothetical protein
VSTYHGTPTAWPASSVVSTEPAKKSLVSMPSGTGANASPNSAIQVVPIIATSGVVPAAMAVWNLSRAASQGIGTTSMSTSGLASTKSCTKSGRASPSVPMAHTESSPLASPDPRVDASVLPVLPVSSERPHAVSAVRASAVTRATRAAGRIMVRSSSNGRCGG